MYQGPIALHLLKEHHNDFQGLGHLVLLQGEHQGTATIPGVELPPKKNPSHGHVSVDQSHHPVLRSKERNLEIFLRVTRDRLDRFHIVPKDLETERPQIVKRSHFGIYWLHRGARCRLCA